MKVGWSFLFPSLLLVTLIAGLSLFLAHRIPSSARPQRADGTDALSVAFGGAKEVVSEIMFHTADSYFHGGVDLDGEHTPPSIAFAPWRWINARVRAPEIERHLSGRATVELMPWFWAAVKANPHNVEAWTTAMYVAERMMKDDALVRRVLAEAKEKNPQSPEIAFAEGKFLYQLGKGDVPAARRAFLRAKALLEGATTEKAVRLRQMTENYLAHMPVEGATL